MSQDFIYCGNQMLVCWFKLIMLYSILVENHEKIKLSKTNTSDRGKVFSLVVRTIDTRSVPEKVLEPQRENQYNQN